MRSQYATLAGLLGHLGLVLGTEISDLRASLNEIAIRKAEDVRGHIRLPETLGEHEISWSSSDPDVISPGGIVHRQSDSITVNLTATVSVDATILEHTISATVRPAVRLEPFEGYTFSYFTGSSLAGENIFFAASNGNDALSWTELNAGQPVLTSSEGTGGLRDPFLIRSPEGDTFYLIATDLSIGSGTSWDDAVRRGSQYLEIWESNDLINWSDQRHIKLAPDNAGNTWAPEAFFDDSIGEYIVFWASSLYDDENDPEHNGVSYHRMMYATTRDFVTFGEPVIWQDNGLSRIDSTVIKESNTYYRFTKDEGAGGTGCSDIIQEGSQGLRDTLDSWTVVATCIGRDAGTQAVEGPTAFKSNPNDVHGEKFYLFVDEYVDRGYIPLQTDDLANPDWQVASEYDLPSSPRHGTVLPVTAAELEALHSGAQGSSKRATMARR